MATPFSVDILRTIYDDDIKNLSYFDYIVKGLESTTDIREEDFLPLIPNTIKYIKDNIYHADTGEYYVTSYLKEKGQYLKPLSKDLLENNLYVCYFPPLVKKWFGSYATLYQIVNDETKDRTYIEDGINYLNLCANNKKEEEKKVVRFDIPPPSIEHNDINNLEEFFKGLTSTKTEEEFNTIITPIQLFEIYCEVYKDNAVKKNIFLEEIKKLPFLEIKAKRIKGSNTKNHVFPDYKKCIEYYNIIPVHITEPVIAEKVIPQDAAVTQDAVIPLIVKQKNSVSSVVKKLNPEWVALKKNIKESKEKGENAEELQEQLKTIPHKIEEDIKEEKQKNYDAYLNFEFDF